MSVRSNTHNGPSIVPDTWVSDKSHGAHPMFSGSGWFLSVAVVDYVPLFPNGSIIRWPIPSDKNMSLTGGVRRIEEQTPGKAVILSTTRNPCEYH